MTKEKLIEIENLIRDLRMLLEFKESMDKDEPFVILPVSKPISVVFDLAKKREVNLKITQLADKLKTKLGALK